VDWPNYTRTRATAFVTHANDTVRVPAIKCTADSAGVHCGLHKINCGLVENFRYLVLVNYDITCN
jgi:hypothetical protein